jgi:hypothetical protein
MIIGIFLAFCTGWFISGVNISNRKLKGVHPGFVILWPAIVGTVIFLSILTIRFLVSG